jgi:hypothetical protein
MEIEGVPEHPIPILITRQFLGELEVRQILPPLLQFPPAGGGNLTSAILTSPHPHPLEQQNAHRVSLSLL